MSSWSEAGQPYLAAHPDATPGRTALTLPPVLSTEFSPCLEKDACVQCNLIVMVAASCSS